jgi:hypothetical protein
MSEEPKLDATFYAFRKREKRFVLTGAVLGYLSLTIVSVGAFVALTWNAWVPLVTWYMGAMGALSSGGEPSAPPMHALLAIAPFYALMFPIGIILLAMLEAACLRWLVRGEAGGGLLGLKLDGDTWRVVAIYLMWIAYFIVLSIAVAVFYGVLVWVGSFGGVAQFLAILLGALAPIGLMAIMIWGAVLFAPAAATSVGQRRFAFFTAPKVVGKRFWSLLTAFLIVIVAGAVISYVLQLILQLPMQAAIMQVMAAAMNGADEAQIFDAIKEAFSSPIVLISFALQTLANLIITYLLYVALYGVNARAFEAAVEAGDVERAAAA